MTLRQLCTHFKADQTNEDMCEYYKNEYMLKNKDRYNYEYLDESDIIGLRSYLMCWVLALYEYLAHHNNINEADWLSKYKDMVCTKEDNDYYKSLVELHKVLNSDKPISIVDTVFNNMLSESIQEFKARGIVLKVIYNNA